MKQSKFYFRHSSPIAIEVKVATVERDFPAKGLQYVVFEISSENYSTIVLRHNPEDSNSYRFIPGSYVQLFAVHSNLIKGEISEWGVRYFLSYEEASAYERKLEQSLINDDLNDEYMYLLNFR
jgi:hypothetical protein